MTPTSFLEAPLLCGSRHCSPVRLFPVVCYRFGALTCYSLDFRVGAVGFREFNACALAETMESVTICVVVVLLGQIEKCRAPCSEWLLHRIMGARRVLRLSKHMPRAFLGVLDQCLRAGRAIDIECFIALFIRDGKAALCPFYRRKLHQLLGH